MWPPVIDVGHRGSTETSSRLEAALDQLNFQDWIKYLLCAGGWGAENETSVEKRSDTSQIKLRCSRTCPRKGIDKALWECRGGKENLTVRWRRAREVLWARGWHVSRNLKKVCRSLTGIWKGKAALLGRGNTGKD